MHPRKPESTRQRAAELRKQGTPLTTIAAELKVGISVLSDWLRDTPVKVITCICGKELGVTHLNKKTCSDECAKEQRNLKFRTRYAESSQLRDKTKAKYRATKLEVMQYYCKGTPHCQCPSGKCNETILEFLTIDHVDNNGAQERRERTKAERRGTGSRTYVWLKQQGYPEGYRVLCWKDRKSVV